MGRPLSASQIHQKIILILGNFHKTTSEHWRRILGTQKGSPISSKGVLRLLEKKDQKSEADGLTPER